MKLLPAVAMVLGAFATSAQAASLPAPAKLCTLIAATADEGNNKIPPWQKSGNEYFCQSNGMSALGDGVVFMNLYQATGPTPTHSQNLLFQLKMYDSQLRTNQISQLILPRITATFDAAGAGPVPADLVQAINNGASASVSTTLGTIQTRFIPATGTSSPYNGAVFELELHEVSNQPASALSRDENIARCVGLGNGFDADQTIASCTVLLKSSHETALFLASGYCNRGNAYFQKGLMEKAIADFTKAIALTPDQFQPHHNRGHVYETMGQSEKAIADYRVANTLKPGDDDTIQSLKRLGAAP